jgi:uncharacterized membrane protein (DUF2068 family)
LKASLHLQSAREIGLRLAAIFEAAKGLLVLVVGSGLLFLVHRDVANYAERLIAHAHLNPASHYPRIFLKVATEATPGRLRLIALGALIYAIVRFVEAVGLWHARRWAEWLGVASGLIYLPLEARAMIRRPGIEPLVALLLNLGVVLFLGLQLESREAAPAASPPVSPTDGPGRDH